MLVHHTPGGAVQWVGPGYGVPSSATYGSLRWWQRWAGMGPEMRAYLAGRRRRVIVVHQDLWGQWAVSR